MNASQTTVAVLILVKTHMVLSAALVEVDLDLIGTEQIVLVRNVVAFY